MGAFFKNYSITVNKKYVDTLNIFRDNLDDMSTKGYTMTKYVINNSDHKSKYFSGEYKNNCFVVRQTDSGTDDFYFRILPKHKISFEATSEGTKVKVKSSNAFAFSIFCLFIFAFVLTFSLLILPVTLGEAKALTLLYSLIPLALSLIMAFFSNSLINDTQTTLTYIYKQKDLR